MTITTALADSLPELYRTLLPELTSLVVPKETRASCDDCAMCAPVDAALPPSFRGKSFNPETKCCTYHPTLANFLVGAILSDESEAGKEGRRRVQASLGAGIGVRPRGLSPSRKFSVLYDNSHGAFGKASSLVCPYYDHGACTVWAYREATCSTWFCKYVRGERSRDFWSSVKRYLANAEHKLALYAVAQLIDDGEHLGRIWESWDNKEALTDADIDDRPPTPSDRAALWGAWLGREEEFYRRCYEIVRSLSAAETTDLMGAEAVLFRRKLGSAGRVFSDDRTATTLLRNPELCSLKRGDGYLCSNRPGDCFELHGLFYPLLEYFDGKTPTEEVRRRIQQEKNIELSEATVTQLFHLGVLIAPPA